MKQEEKIKDYVSIFIIVTLLLTFTYIFFTKYLYVFKSIDGVRNFILKYRSHSVLVFIFLQIIQVVIFMIPGEVVQIAGGYIFGTFFGSLYSIIGITIGGVICFIIARKLGESFVKGIVNERQLLNYKNKLKSKNFLKTIFVLYLIPGVPKDILCYIAGVCSISIKDFLVYSTLGRIPCIIISAYFGTNIYVKNKNKLIAISILIALILIIIMLQKENIIKSLGNTNRTRE